MKSPLSPNNPPLLSLQGVTKTYPSNGVTACNSVSLTLFKGEVLSLMGENGAGKSTLASIIEGSLSPDRGNIHYLGNNIPGMVHQKPLVVDNFSVIDMILAGNLSLTGLWRQRQKSLQERAKQIIGTLDFTFSLNSKMVSLKPYEYQQVELLESLLLKRDLIILDEPGFPHLDNIIDTLKHEGKSLIVITHKLEEALSLSDRIIVMQRGNVSLDAITSRTTESEVVEHLVWEEKVDPLADSSEKHKGEILVIAGLHESGLWDEEERLAKKFHGTDCGYLPSAARQKAMEGSWSTLDNLMIHKRHHMTGRWGFINRTLWIERGRELIKRAKIKARPEDHMDHLSGGNQKKLLLLREIERPGSELLLSEPTSALDLVNRERLYNQLREARRKGKKIILLTSDPEEALLLGDNIIPLHNGIRGKMKKQSDFTVATLSSAMRGVNK